MEMDAPTNGAVTYNGHSGGDSEDDDKQEQDSGHNTDNDSAEPTNKTSSKAFTAHQGASVMMDADD